MTSFILLVTGRLPAHSSLTWLRLRLKFVLLLMSQSLKRDGWPQTSLVRQKGIVRQNLQLPLLSQIPLLWLRWLVAIWFYRLLRKLKSSICIIARDALRIERGLPWTRC